MHKLNKAHGASPRVAGRLFFVASMVPGDVAFMYAVSEVLENSNLCHAYSSSCSSISSSIVAERNVSKVASGSLSISC